MDISLLEAEACSIASELKHDIQIMYSDRCRPLEPRFVSVCKSIVELLNVKRSITVTYSRKGYTAVFERNTPRLRSPFSPKNRENLPDKIGMATFKALASLNVRWVKCGTLIVEVGL